MKRIFFIASVLLAQFTFAQEQETVSTDEKKCVLPKTDIYIGVGGVFYNDFSLNQKIRASGMPEIRETMPELMIGINSLWEKYSFDMDLSTSYSNKKNSTTQNKFASGTLRLRGHYNFVNKSRILLSGGLNVAYTHNDLNLYSRNNDINLNDLNPENNSGHVSLKNDIFYAGPSLAFNLKRKEKLSIRLNVGYEFAFTNGKWKSDYASVSNSVKENGQNRLMVGVVFF